MNPIQFYKCLADETRLKCIVLICQENELCVCELTEALQVSQPKISRHLAQLRECGLLTDRREGQWVFYSISQALPTWAKAVITTTAEGDKTLFTHEQKRLNKMGSRPERKSACC